MVSGACIMQSIHEGFYWISDLTLSLYIIQLVRLSHVAAHSYIPT